MEEICVSFHQLFWWRSWPLPAWHSLKPPRAPAPVLEPAVPRSPVLRPGLPPAPVAAPAAVPAWATPRPHPVRRAGCPTRPARAASALRAPPVQMPTATPAVRAEHRELVVLPAHGIPPAHPAIPVRPAAAWEAALREGPAVPRVENKVQPGSGDAHFGGRLFSSGERDSMFGAPAEFPEFKDDAWHGFVGMNFLRRFGKSRM